MRRINWLILLGLLQGCGGSVNHSQPKTPEVWLTVISPFDLIPSNPGASDYMDIFTHPEKYPEVLAHLTVLKLYSQTINNAPDADLKQIFQFVAAHNIKLAVEIPLIVANDPRCQGEGSSGPGFPDMVAKRVRNLGGKLDYAAMDEELDFYFTMGQTGGINYCPFYTIEGLAQNIGGSINILKSYFPDIQIGDIENGLQPDHFTAEWFDAIDAILGKPLTFFHDDALIDTDYWQAATPGLQAMLKQRHIPYGVIINGRNEDTTDSVWVQTAISRFRLYNNLNLGLPKDLVYQSWNRVPDHLLPETDPTSMTYLIKTTLGL